jgi:16S rRNA (adenine1518-N6/adenine1519-N6)-dimethyltransferase
VVTGDALELDWHELLSRYPIPDTRYRPKIVGNIPYNITSPLIDKALTPPLPDRIVFLVQDEVAQRAAAAPGSRIYGGLSVGVQAVCRVERLFTVAPGAFRPVPKVRSALVRLTPHAEPLVRTDEVVPFRRFVTACFSRRRKQLRNVIAGVTDRPAAEVARALLALGLDPAARPETLAPGDFVRLLRWSREL